MLTLAAPASSQDADTTAGERRPSLAIPEPERRSPVAQLPLLVSVRYEEAEDGVDRYGQALPNLVKFIHEETRVGVLLRTADMALGDPRANGAALLHLTGHRAALGFSQTQRRWLGEYLRAGGLLYAEDVVTLVTNQSYVMGAGQSGSVFDAQVRELMSDAAVLGRAGRSWSPVPDDHPLLTSFFSFPKVPPPGGEEHDETAHLQMLEWRGRTVVLLSELNITWAWVSSASPGRVRGFQFGTNLVVFALANQSAGPFLRGSP
jgi:hypothetical protein